MFAQLTHSVSPVMALAIVTVLMVMIFLTKTLSSSPGSGIYFDDKYLVPVSTQEAYHEALRKRHSSNLVYWTPHKTGSTSMRWWLKLVAQKLGIRDVGGSIYYPFSNISDHELRLNLFSPNRTCNIVMGHIRAPPIAQRHDERKLGAVITTTRLAFNTLASKYFHRTAEKLTPTTLKSFQVIGNQVSRRWFLYWHDSNPCEPLQYYDGLDDCILDEPHIAYRVRQIVNRIDCSVDMDDPDLDIQAICQQLQISANNCPEFPERNTREGRSLYDDLHDLPHIRKSLDNNMYVTNMLRKSLMMKRCRFLHYGNLTPPGYEKPVWPSATCTWDVGLENTTKIEFGTCLVRTIYLSRSKQ